MIPLLHERIIEIEINLEAEFFTVFRFFLFLNFYTNKHQQFFSDVIIFYIIFD